MMFRHVAAACSETMVGLRPAQQGLRLVAAILAGFALLCPGLASAEQRFAVIPTQTIYPGELLDEGHLQAVEVTNPDLAGDYATDKAQVIGKVTTRTLLAGRVILVAALRDPYTVERGKPVRLVFSNGPLTITAGGSPLDNASIGDIIKVRNTDSGIVVAGTVMADGTVHVVSK